MKGKKPHGMCTVKFKYGGELSRDAKSKNIPYYQELSFNGYCTFVNGEISGGPAIFFKENGSICSISEMHAGRPT